MLAYAKDFYDAWRKYEWNLFDWNVRLQLYKSRINKRIISSLGKSKTQKIFHHLNNGITITCKNYSINTTKNQITLEKPQIINGCQTVCAIRDAYDALTPYNQRSFDENARIQVKIIKTVDIDFISQLVVTTNDQNPMSSRNLKSNSAEQKEIQKNFRLLNTKWFYQRKDGEWDSLKASDKRVRWFKSSDFITENRRFRMIDNKELAKAWYSWIGHSDKVLKGGFDYFDNDDVYNLIFKRSPNKSFWEGFNSSPYYKSVEEHFDTNTPKVYQYLLAYTVHKFVKQQRISWRENRTQALERGVEKGELEFNENTQRITNSQVDIDNYLKDDIEYKLNIIINNTSDIIVELFAFLLTRKCRELSSGFCRNFLQSSDIEMYVCSNFHRDYLPKPNQNGNQILGPMYEFIKYCLKQYYFENQAEILASPRLKAYFFQRKIVERLKDTLLKHNENIIEFNTNWKKAELTFIDSLPSLE